MQLSERVTLVLNYVLANKVLAIYLQSVIVREIGL
jgi:hypothetical protein